MRVQVSHNERTIGGSALLAVCITANAWYSLLIFVVAAWAHYQDKLMKYNMSPVDRAWYGAIIAFWMLGEAPRLMLGNKGNTKQSGALMFAFLALTAFDHIVIMFAYIFVIPKKSSLDVALGSVQLLLAGLEIIFGLYNMMSMVKSNTIDFYVGLKRAS